MKKAWKFLYMTYRNCNIRYTVPYITVYGTGRYTLLAPIPYRIFRTIPFTEARPI